MTDTTQDSHDLGSGLPQVAWWLIVALGLLSIVAGILALVWPGKTLLLVALAFGIFLLLSGIGDLIGAFRATSASKTARFFFGFLGLLAIVAGVILIARPAQSLLTAAWVIGLWFGVSGAVQLAQGFGSSDGRVYNILFGLIGLVVGVIILVRPGVGIVTLVWIVSLGFIIRGMVTIAVGLVVRKATGEPALT